MDFRAFEATPGISVILLPNAPLYTLVAVSNDFIQATGLKREALIGTAHFSHFPKSPDDLHFTGEQNLRASFEYIVQHKVAHEIPLQRYDIPKGDGTFLQKYWKVKNVPLLNNEGEVAFIIHTAVDITEQMMAEQRVEAGKGMEKVYHLFMNAPVIITIVKGDDYIIELANEGMLQIWGKGAGVIGKPLLEAIPELKEQGIIALLDQVRRTGESFKAFESPSTLMRNGKEETLYFDFIYQPYYEEGTTGMATGIIGVAHDVTEQVLARQKVTEITERLNFRNALFEAQNNATPDGVLIVDAKGKMLLQNKRFEEIWQMPKHIIESGDDAAAQRHAMTLLINPQGFIDRINYLYNNKKEKSHELVFFKDGRVIERSGTPILAENGLYYGWAWYFRDITDRIKQDQKFKNVVEQAADPILILKGEDMVLEVANEALLRLWKVDHTAIGKTFLEILPEMRGQGFLELLQQVYHTGEPFHGVEVPAVFDDKDGKERKVYFNFTYQPYKEVDGSITGVLVLATDVTGQVIANQKLVESERNLRNTLLQAPVAMAILRGPQFVVEIANDRMYELWGRNKEELLNKSIFEGLPEVQSQGYEELLTGVYTTGTAFSAFGIPVTLPRNSGIETVYINLLYEAFREGDGTISGIMAVATDVTEQVLASRKIEEVVAQRTHELEHANAALTRSNLELKRSNTNLEEFAHAASHDMKEPIRKILTFTDRLKLSLEARLTETEKGLFGRVESATQRMGLLVDDLLEFSHVSERPLEKEDVNLNVKVKKVLIDLELLVEEKKAQVQVGALPTLKGYKRQLQQLLQNLIGNALKYSKPDQAPVVTITSQNVYGYEVGEKVLPEQSGQRFHLLEVRDNGIGFEPEYAEKIFGMFQRLHGKGEYPGTGVGLSIARKVVDNHNGYIWAESEPGEGASFKILLPAN